MKTQRCRNSVASPLRSRAIGSSIRPSRTGRQGLEVTNCTGPSSSMPSPAPTKATWAVQFSRRTCLMTRTITCEPKKRRKLRYSPSAWLSCYHLTRSWPVGQRKSAWTSWFCPCLRMPIPQLQQLARRQDADRSSQRVDQPPPPLVCPCHHHVIDSHGTWSTWAQRSLAVAPICPWLAGVAAEKYD